MNKRKVLDKGFVELLSVTGTDLTPLEVINFDTSDIEKVKKALRSMVKHNRVPFEHVVFQFKIKCPLFVLQELIRQSEGSFVEVPRYKLNPEFYNPAYFISFDPKTYKADRMSEETCNELTTKTENFYKWTNNFYQKLLSNYSMTREMAQMFLPLGVYTEVTWTVTAKELMTFLNLYSKLSIYTELCQYMEILFDFFAAKLPLTSEIFNKLK